MSLVPGQLERPRARGLVHRSTDGDAFAPVFSANWTNTAAGFEVAGWVKEGGIVRLFGLITKAVAVVANEVIMTVPAPAPSGGLSWCLSSGEAGFGRLDVQVVAGVVQLVFRSGGTAGGGAGTFLTLSSVWWPVG